MKVAIQRIEIEGTREEVSPYLERALHDRSGTSATRAAVLERAEEETSLIPTEVAQFIRGLTLTAAAHETAEEVVKRVLALGRDIKARLGPSYVRFHRTDALRRMGAFMYFKPGNLMADYRLSDPKGSKIAKVREVEARNAYKVRCYLRSREAVEEGLRLARLAYEKAT